MMKDFFKQLEERTARYKWKYKNAPRTASLHLLIWNIKSLFKKWSTAETVINKETTFTNGVLFNLMGGIGDILITINFLIQLKEKINCDIDFYITVPDVLYTTIETLVSKHNFLKLYHRNPSDTFIAELNLCRIPKIISYNHTAITEKSSFFANWLQQIQTFNELHPEYLNSGTTSDYLCTRYTQYSHRNRLQMPDINNLIGTESVYEIPTSSESEILSKFDLTSNTYLTLQCGTGALSGNELSTREWPIDRYNELIKLIKNYKKDIKLVQIGNSKDPQMITDIDLRGKTSFNEMLVILKNAKLHIGGESGCIHMRHFMGARPSVVIFGPTSMEFYAYPENINISSDICSGCEWLHNHWRECCIKTGTTKSACLQDITATNVMNKIKGVL